MQVVILKNTYDLLVDKVDEIKAEIKVNAADLQKAADFGDLRENAEYETAKKNREFLFNKLGRFEKYLHCRVMDKSDISPDVISFGTTIEILDKKSDNVRKYNIVGPVEYELESLPDIVTYTSPLAKQLIGKKKGDEVEVQLPNRVDSIKILDVKPIE